MQQSLYKIITAIVLITIFVCTAHAEIYTCKDAKGATVYTDSPSACNDAEEIKTDKLPTLVPSKSLTTRPSTRINKAGDENSYDKLEITSPSNDSTIRDNQGNLTINFQATPALKTRLGHKYIVTMNGAEIYSGTSTITALKNVDRGTQTLVVKVVDAEGKVMITSEAVKATLQRFSAQERIDLPGSGGLPTLGDTGVGQFSLPTLPRSTPPAPPTPPPPTTPSSGINN